MFYAKSITVYTTEMAESARLIRFSSAAIAAANLKRVKKQTARHLNPKLNRNGRDSLTRAVSFGALDAFLIFPLLSQAFT
jgi:hypothetical protein